MLCQNCKKREATVNHVTTVNGETCAYHLCAECAAEMFGEFEKQVANAFLGGLFGESVREVKKCPACGMTFADYRRTGLLGCPSCYDVFKEELLPHIAKIQGETRHVGKAGGVYTAEHDDNLKLARLQDAMEAAMQRGDFAEAGRINEQMNAIKKRPQGGWRW